MTNSKKKVNGQKDRVDPDMPSTQARMGRIIPNFQAITTKGEIDLHEWLGKSWGLLFSHPAPFTPICTSEVGSLAKSIEVTAGGATFKCALPSVATQIVNWVHQCRTYCPVRYFACGGYGWHVGWCGKGAEITVGGRGVCGCRARLTIRPCVNNPSWGGYGGRTCTARSQQMSVKVEPQGDYLFMIFRRLIFIL